MGTIAVTAEGLGKKYLIGEAQRANTIRDAVSGLARLSRHGRREAREFWALSDVSFEVERGECLGIVGRNGAGKSTLLKILSRITEPTTGRVALKGRVASLLEVGTGFHPELTGRENILLNGAILGMRKAEIQRRFDAIVAFSEVEAFLDTPVKRYSSGMYMRLAFAIAAHLDPEVLLVDEVLAVGDVQFQRKCLGKMGEVARAGRTVLFVSHNMLAIERLCQRALLLEAGKLAFVGPAAEAVSLYMGRAENSSYEMPAGSRSEPHFTFATVRPALAGARLLSSAPLTLLVDWTVPGPCPGLRVGFGIDSREGVRIFGSAPEDSGIAAPSLPGRYRATIRVPGDLFLAGHYAVALCLWGRQGAYDYPDPAFGFKVDAAPSLAYAQDDSRAGLLQVKCDWTIAKLHALEGRDGNEG